MAAGTDATAIDADRALVLMHVRRALRPAIGALWRLDAVLGAALAGTREPMVGRIKLAWWRDALAALDTAPAPPEPVLRGLAAEVLPRGVRGSMLAQMTDGWAALTDNDVMTADARSAYAEARGGVLFRLSARLLGDETHPHVDRAGAGWALADLGRHSASREEAAAALEAARPLLEPRHRWPAELRPLAMLAALAVRDCQRGVDAVEPPGSPARAALILRVRLTGR